MTTTSARQRLRKLDECERQLAAALNRPPCGGFIRQEQIDAADNTQVECAAYVIYALHEPGNLDDIRYVGVTSDAATREKTHNLRRNKPKGELYRWIASLHVIGLRPGFRVLASVIGQPQKAEQEAIAQWKRTNG